MHRTANYGTHFGNENEHTHGVTDYKIDGIETIDYYSIAHGIETHVGAWHPLSVRTFSDSDYDSDPRDRKSLLGFVVMVYGGVVACYSKKMKSVARSTTEAEYVAMSEALKQILWLRTLVAILEGHPTKLELAIPMLVGDNAAAIQITNGTSNTSKVKHIDIAYHHIIDEVRKKYIATYWVSGDNNLADGFTKPQPKDLLERHRASMGIRATSY